MDVGAYSRDFRSLVTYQIIVTVPDNRRRANMKMPQEGSNVSVYGILSYISVHEDIAAIELENLSYLLRTNFPSKYESTPSPGGKTKRQLVAEKSTDSVDIGNPMKKSKSGPIDAFTPEELGAGSSSGSNASSSSGSRTGSSPASSIISPPPPPSAKEASSSRVTRSSINVEATGESSSTPKDNKATKKTQ